MIFWYRLFYWISLLSYFVPLIIQLRILKRNNAERKILSALFLYILLSIVTEIVNMIVSRIIHNNNPIVHIYTILAFLILAFLYKDMLNMKMINKYFYWFVLPYCCLSFYYSFFVVGLLNVNVLTYLILSITLIFISSYYFYRVYIEMTIHNLFNNALFWINSAFLFYFSSTFYLSLFEEIIQTIDSNLFYYTWPIQLVATIIFNVILSKGIWLMRKQ
jgi:hypothetical protein